MVAVILSYFQCPRMGPELAVFHSIVTWLL